MIDYIRNYRGRHLPLLQTQNRSEPVWQTLRLLLWLLLLVAVVVILKHFDNIIMAINMNQGRTRQPGMGGGTQMVHFPCN